MPDRLTGVVTFLFSDIEGSTQLLRTLGADEYAKVLEEHRRLLRLAFDRFDGREEGTEGDSFMAAFSSPRHAIEAAAFAQQSLAKHAWPPDCAVHVRMGIHSGAVTTIETGYVGTAVNRAARIAASAHGDQVLLSATTFDLIEDQKLPFRLTELGQHRLKDLPEPVRLYQLEASYEGQPRVFPPLRTAVDRLTNLPPQPTSLIGREREVAQLRDLLRRADVRLITLTGPGGAGKTSLALDVGAELLADFADGVWFVPLGAISDAALVVPAVAAALSLNEASGQSLDAFLAAKQLLLVIDNFEQVMTAAEDLALLMSAAPSLKAVVTSRQGLRLRGEHVFAVPALSRSDAVELFIRRAQQVRPAFTSRPAASGAIEEICARLDGLPLAIELAAARVVLLSPEQILERLTDRLKLLTGGARDLPARHQTLRATLEWSYGLLAAEEQTVFARLAVFAGSFALEAAEKVCDADLDSVASLVDKSLVRADSGRFELFETVRQYALEQLGRRTDAAATHAAHAAYFADLVKRAFPRRISAESEVSGSLEQDIDNLRAALDHLEATNPDRALAMAADLGWFWHVHSHLAEGRARLDRLLGVSAATGVERARALAALGEVAAWQGDAATARQAITSATETFAARGLEQERALALYELGWGLFVAGQDEEARQAMQESLRIQQSIGDELLINRAQLGLIQMLVALGEVEDVDLLASQSLVVARAQGDLRSEHFAFHFLADSALIRDDTQTALTRYREALRAAVPLGDRVEIVFEVQGVAMALAGSGFDEPALRLASAADAELAVLGMDISGVRFWNELLNRYIGAARIRGKGRTTVASESGQAMDMDTAIAEALQS